MRTINRSSLFNRHAKRAARRIGKNALNALLTPVLEKLANDEPLGDRFREHTLSGTYAGYWECHLRPDLLLLYDKGIPGILELVALGSHADLFR